MMAEKLVSIDECKKILELSIDDVRYYIQEDVIWSVIHYLDEYRRLEVSQSWRDYPEAMGK